MMFKRLTIYLMVPVFSLSMIFNQSAYAESYIGLGLGVSMPQDVTNIKGTTAAGVAGTATDLSPDDAFSYGIKAGHYFNSVPWFGVEMNIFQSDNDVDQQTATATGTAGILDSDTGQVKVDVNSVTTIGFLAMVRATEEQSKNLLNLQPYFGLGFGVNIIDLGDASTFTTAGAAFSSTNLESDTNVGILVSAGLNYKISDNINAYGEYKYTDGSFESKGSDDVTYKYDAGGSNLTFGVAYDF
jgi:opacity protein-like surface antigen